MRLAAGTRVGPYEIIAALGAGAMGEVYRARDERLGRDVAIKVLSEWAAADSEMLRRFELEARAAGSITHPGIVCIHDIGQADGGPFIVTELLEGENLRERLRRGPLTLSSAIDLVMRYKETTKTTREIARELGVDGVVEASFTRAGNQVVITATSNPRTSSSHPTAT